MFYTYHISNEIAKVEMHGRESRAALGWRCRHLRPVELRVLAVARRAVRRWHDRGLRAARAEHTLATPEELLSPK